MTVERNLSVVAHEDDDLIFLNPAIVQGIRRGSPTRTVYVTAGEFNGNGTTREAYAGQRRDGECSAYASMAGVPDEWTRTVMVAGGHEVESSVLDAAPHVELLFLGLPDGGDDQQPHAVPGLWADPTATAVTIVYPDSPVGQPQIYDRAGLLATLVDLMTAFGPTILRIQDAEPDPFLWIDHLDHVAVARFARAAATSYAGDSGNRPIVIEHRDYAIGDFAQNLTDTIAEDKKSVFELYADHDSGAGDLPLKWLPCHLPRWSLGTSWTGSDGDGRQHAFSFQGGSLWNWRQAVAGGPFDGPIDIGGGQLAPSIGVAHNEDGCLAVFAVDLESHEIVTTVQAEAGGDFVEWCSLGNPNGADGPHTGAPAVGANADGRLQIFAKNSGGGVSTTYQTTVNGPFSPWLDLGGGPDVQGRPVCIPRPDGRMALFASRRTSIRMWTQTAPNGAWATPVDITADAITSSPTAARNADGRLEVFWRGQAGDVRTVFELTVDGLWSGAPTSLGGPGGVGEVAALTMSSADDRILLLGSGPGGGIITTSQTRPDAVFAPWRDLGGLSPGTPALASDASGKPWGFHVTTDGRLLITDALDSQAPDGLVRVARTNVISALRHLQAGANRAGAVLTGIGTRQSDHS